MKTRKKQWIFDTVSLSNFLLSDSVSILEKRYKHQAIITSQVYDEISSGFPKYPQLKNIDIMIDRQIFSMHALSATERNLYVRLISFLGKGEASCIAPAGEGPYIVVTYDIAARRECSKIDIPFTGTIGILKTSVIKNDISMTDANNILQKMIDLGFYSPVSTLNDPAR